MRREPDARRQWATIVEEADKGHSNASAGQSQEQLQVERNLAKGE